MVRTQVKISILFLLLLFLSSLSGMQSKQTSVEDLKSMLIEPIVKKCKSIEDAWDRWNRLPSLQFLRAADKKQLDTYLKEKVEAKFNCEDDAVKVFNARIKELSDRWKYSHTECTLSRYAQNNNQEALERLLSHSRDRYESWYRIALMNAIREGYLQIFTILCTYFHDLRYCFSQTEELLYAVTCGSVEIVQRLLDTDCFVEVEDNSMTPLLCAVATKNKNMIQLLLNRGASPYRANTDGLYPIKLAKLQENNDLVDIMQQVQKHK